MIKFVFSEHLKTIPSDTILFVPKIKGDFGFETLFQVWINQENILKSIGFVNVGIIDTDIKNSYQKIEIFGIIEEPIDNMPSEVFTLGKSIEFYDSLQNFAIKNCSTLNDVLRSMRDVSADDMLLHRVKDMPVFTKSFLQSNSIELIQKIKYLLSSSLIFTSQRNTMIDNIKTIVVTMDAISDTDKNYIRENLVAIAKGENSHYSLQTVAKKLKNHLEKLDKSGNPTTNRYGLTAEFFQAVIIRNQGFEQKYSYRNLEENSAKKGFDGLFTKDNEIWLLESKSSFSQSVHQNKHKHTINLAYDGLSRMLSGEKNNRNDPWENAGNHVSQINSNDPLIERLVKLSENYTSKVYQKISESNVILGSGVIHSNVTMIETDIKSLQNDLIKHQAKNELVVLLTFNTPDLFLELLGEFANE